MKRIFRSHACGRSFTLAEWLALPFAYLDYMMLDDATDEITPIVFRDCPCGSTLGVPAEEEGATASDLKVYDQWTADRKVKLEAMMKGKWLEKRTG